VAAEDISTDKHAGVAPVACTLTSAGLAAQAGRWQQLAARAMTARTETTHGLRISFRAVAGAEQELRDLVAVENQCCPWADWAVKPDQGQLVLEVRSTGTGIATLHTMFTSLQRATRPRG
jgi:hypothetical protein